MQTYTLRTSDGSRRYFRAPVDGGDVEEILPGSTTVAVYPLLQHAAAVGVPPLRAGAWPYGLPRLISYERRRLRRSRSVAVVLASTGPHRLGVIRVLQRTLHMALNAATAAAGREHHIVATTDPRTGAAVVSIIRAAGGVAYLKRVARIPRGRPEN